MYDAFYCIGRDQICGPDTLVHIIKNRSLFSNMLGTFKPTTQFYITIVSTGAEPLIWIKPVLNLL
jgi:hypothetical protein